jgi:hypothetical protein
MGEVRNAYNSLVGKSEGRGHSEDRRRWDDNIKMDYREIAWGRCDMDASGSGQGPVAGPREHGNEPSGSMKGGEFRD